MPKPKPDQVIRHEIVLGRSERELIRDAQTMYAIKNVSNIGVEILKDATALAAFWVLFSRFFPGLKFVFSPQADSGEILDSAVNQYASWERERRESGRYEEGASTLFGGVFNLLSNLIRPFTDPPEFGTFDRERPGSSSSMYDTTDSGGGGGGQF